MHISVALVQTAIASIEHLRLHILNDCWLVLNLHKSMPHFVAVDKLILSRVLLLR